MFSPIACGDQPSPSPGAHDTTDPQTFPMRVAVPILLRRGLYCFKRRPDLAAVRIMQAVVLRLFITFFFTPLKTDYPSVENRLGVVQQILAGGFSCHS